MFIPWACAPGLVGVIACTPPPGIAARSPAFRGVVWFLSNTNTSADWSGPCEAPGGLAPAGGALEGVTEALESRSRVLGSGSGAVGTSM